MDRRERAGDAQAAMIAAFEGHQSEVWTALPGIVESYDAGKNTVSIQPAIKAQVLGKDGAKSWTALPLLLDCPVVFQRGGGVTLTFPIKAGDECLVVFASRCIDGWWQSGGIQNQPDLRMHDLSDGFAFVGPWATPNVISDISVTRAQLRSDDQEAFVEIDPTSHFVRVRTTGKIELNADSDILIQSATKIDIKAPAVNVEAAAAFTAKAPAISYYGNMQWFGYTGGAGTVSTNNMTINWNTVNFNWNNVNLIAAGGALVHDGRNIGSTHVHPYAGGTTNIPNP